MIKRAVITGATGTIGMALIKILIEKNIECHIITRKNSSRKRFIPVNPLVKIHYSDLKDIGSIRDFPSQIYDVFFHMGWSGSNVDDRNQSSIQNVNIKYSTEAVELAHNLGCKTFIGAGSQSEFGQSDVKLSYKVPARPISAYGIAKLRASEECQKRCALYKMKFIWPRILSVYGPFTGMDSVLMSSIKAFMDGYSLPYTKCEQLWDYMYSKDAAYALYLLAEYGKNRHIYCIGSGETQKLSTYLETLRDLINPQITLKFGELPYRIGQAMYLCADISDLCRDTGFKVKYSFKEGIEETLRWYKETHYEKSNIK